MVRRFTHLASLILILIMIPLPVNPVKAIDGIKTSSLTIPDDVTVKGIITVVHVYNGHTHPYYKPIEDVLSVIPPKYTEGITFIVVDVLEYGGEPIRGLALPYDKLILISEPSIDLSFIHLYRCAIAHEIGHLIMYHPGREGEVLADLFAHTVGNELHYEYCSIGYDFSEDTIEFYNNITITELLNDASDCSIVIFLDGSVKTVKLDNISTACRR